MNINNQYDEYVNRSELFWDRIRSICKFSCGIILINCFLLEPTSAETWSDNTGNFTVQAEFVGISGKNILLKKSNGATITVPITRLSDSSRALAKKLYQASKRAPMGLSEKSDTDPSEWVPTDFVNGRDLAVKINGVTKRQSSRGGTPTVPMREGMTSVIVDLTLKNLTKELTRVRATSIKLVDKFGRLVPSQDKLEADSPTNRKKLSQLSVKVMEAVAEELGFPNNGLPKPPEIKALGPYDEDEEDRIMRAIKLEPNATVRRSFTFHLPNDTAHGSLSIDVPSRGRGTEFGEALRQMQQQRSDMERMAAEAKKMSSEMKKMKAAGPGNALKFPTFPKPAGYSPTVLNQCVRIVIQKSMTSSSHLPMIGDSIKNQRVVCKVVGFEEVSKLPDSTKGLAEDTRLLAVDYSLENWTKQTLNADTTLENRSFTSLFLRHEQDGRTFLPIKSFMIKTNPTLVPEIPKALTAYFPIPSGLLVGPWSVVIAESSSIPLFGVDGTSPKLFSGVEVALRKDPEKPAKTISLLTDINRTWSGGDGGENRGTANPALSKKLETPDHLLDERFRFNDYAYTFHNIQTAKAIGVDYLREPAPQGTIFIIVSATIENLRGNTQVFGVGASRFSLLTKDGFEFGRSSSAAVDSLQSGLQECHPNVPIKNRLAFIVPEKYIEAPLRLRLRAKGFLASKGTCVEVDLAKKTQLKPDSRGAEFNDSIESGKHINPASQILEAEIGLESEFVIQDFSYTFKGHEQSKSMTEPDGDVVTVPENATSLVINYEATNQGDTNINLEPSIRLVDHQGRTFLPTIHNAVNESRVFGPGKKHSMQCGFVVPNDLIESPFVLDFLHFQWRSFQDLRGNTGEKRRVRIK